MTLNNLRLEAIKYKYSKGLIPRESDLYFVLSTWLEEKKLDAERSLHQPGVDGGVRQSVRKTRRGRPKKERVREGDSLRTDDSTQETSTMEGGS